MDSAELRELAALVADRRGAVDARTRLVNQLSGVLKHYYPQALTLAGEDLAAPLAIAFLRRFPELAAVQKAGANRLRAFYTKHNVRSEQRIDERLALLGRARALSEERAVIEPSLLALARLLDLLVVEARHIAAYDTRIASVFAVHPNAEVFAALPGAGPALAPRLLVAFGDVTARYPNAQALQKYAGLAPVREKSQKRVWVEWHLVKWIEGFDFVSFCGFCGQSIGGYPPATSKNLHRRFIEQLNT
ncbi:MAG: transposase [Opitutus sp.]|nr:transposase [Opitutus sp.]MCS6248683.1 transposase [Opitutus sp.]MCS6275524.1 transposase [Opitutus sp.]MCS6275732.1 transposase [Opitutus sp.]MCS6300828.1 transposase [Opitutus sp.]